MERRKVGQDVQKLKRWQQEQELKEMMDERNRERKENQEARQRVLAQIAQDKAERAAKFANSSNTVSKPPEELSPQAQSIRRNVSDCNTARLQFKLPDGTTHMHNFSSTSSLHDVRNYIISNLNLPYENFSLSTTFPRREFTTENGSQTLLELELVPNAVILILPLQHGAVSTNTDSWLMTVFWSFIGPILNFVGFLKSKIFGSSSSTSSTVNKERKRPNDNVDEQSR